MSCIGIDSNTEEDQFRFTNIDHDTTNDLTFTINGANFKMMKVDGESFPMGKTKETLAVSINSFYIGETEVTAELWNAIMKTDEFANDKTPVNKVSWNDCQVFIKRLNALTGRKFRLPTEAEWMYVATEGMGVNYEGVDLIWDNSTSKHLQLVALLPPNKYNVYDILGNLWEWCYDGYQSNYNQKITNPTALTGVFRAVRGGSWENDTDECTPFNSKTYAPDNKDRRIGFRLAMSE